MSKELENLKELEVWATNGYTACDVEKAKELVKPIEKSLKALNIIKNKRVDVAIFYELDSSSRYRIPLTKEEYKLLKEITNETRN